MKLKHVRELLNRIELLVVEHDRAMIENNRLRLELEDAYNEIAALELASPARTVPEIAESMNGTVRPWPKVGDLVECRTPEDARTCLRVSHGGNEKFPHQLQVAACNPQWLSFDPYLSESYTWRFPSEATS